MNLKGKLDVKGMLVLNGENYWTHYRKMANILGSIKVIKVKQINVSETLYQRTPKYRYIEIIKGFKIYEIIAYTKLIHAYYRVF